MKYVRWLTAAVCVVLIVAGMLDPAQGRGGGRGGGFSGGGGRGGFSGGGGSRGSFGGAPSFSRPSMSASRPSSSFSRPSTSISRPSTSISRPSTGISRPSTLPSRPSVSGGRPSLGQIPSGLQPGSRPSVGSRPSQLPSGIQPGSRPQIGGGPSQLPATRPGLGSGIAGQRPGVGQRPEIGTRPGQLPSTRPGISQLPGAGIGAGAGAIAGSRLPGRGERPAQLPGLDGGSRWDQIRDNRPEWVADRSGDLQGRLENRQDFLNDWQDNRQDFLNDRREDWQNQLDDRCPWHDDWHHGYWCGGWGNYWEHMWEEHPVWSAFGVTRWAWNSASYLFGLGYYSNPYWDSGYASTTVYDYSQPIVTYSEPVTEVDATGAAPAGETALPPGVSSTALDTFSQARVTFQEGDYQKALELTDETLRSMPSDAVVHEFRALCLFALGDYRQAAATLNPVLAVGPGWDWTTMASLYPDVEVYTAQLRKLEQYLREHPDAADARFVLSYHYLTAGHKDAAAQQLAVVAQEVPSDAVAKEMYDALTYKPSAEATPPVAYVPEPSGPQIAAADMVGSWKAAGPGNTSFGLTLTADGEFTWKYTRGVKEETVRGAYAVDRNTLAMEPEAGGVMLAELTPQDNSAFAFKMVGAEDSDPPLTFTR